MYDKVAVCIHCVVFQEYQIFDEKFVLMNELWPMTVRDSRG